jgi:hypothetical protein
MLNWLPKFGWLIALIDDETDDDVCLSYASPESEPNDPRWDDEGDPALLDFPAEDIYNPR